MQEIGEQALLKRLQSFCPPEFVGDDAAVLQLPPGRSLIVTADMLVDGVHFSDRTTSAADAGWRAAAANLSDLAAMGATPLGITVSLGLPGTVTIAWVEQLYQGLTECLQTYGTAIVGGDVCRSPVITIAITAFGAAEPQRIIRRSTAQVGDAIVVTGVHGASRAGLELLLQPDQAVSLSPSDLSPSDLSPSDLSPSDLSPSDRTTLIQAHQRPKPRLDVLPLLHSIPRVAGMDSSDGLADAIVQLCRASGVGATVDRQQIPMPGVLAAWIGAERAIEWALYGGEDFELVLCLPPESAKPLVQQLGAGAAIVGSITAGSEVWLIDSTGNQLNEQLILERGFQHFGSDRVT